jgi:anti-sigma B factor antagonist
VLRLIDRSEDLVIAALPQDVDFCTGPDVRAAGERLLADGCRYLVLDSSPVAYLDSSGITVLVGFWQHLRNAGGALVLAVSDEHLRWRLGVLGLDSAMTITTTLDEAVTRARRLRDAAHRPTQRIPSAADTGRA